MEIWVIFGIRTSIPHQAEQVLIDLSIKMPILSSYMRVFTVPQNLLTTYLPPGEININWFDQYYTNNYCVLSTFHSVVSMYLSYVHKTDLTTWNNHIEH